MRSTSELVQNAWKAGTVIPGFNILYIPVEAELGAVMGHEEGPLLSYEELFSTGKGFTSPGEAKRFMVESEADWFSATIINP